MGSRSPLCMQGVPYTLAKLAVCYNVQMYILHFGYISSHHVFLHNLSLRLAPASIIRSFLGEMQYFVRFGPPCILYMLFCFIYVFLPSCICNISVHVCMYGCTCMYTYMCMYVGINTLY